MVTATTCHPTEIGRANISNLARYATTIEVTANRTVICSRCGVLANAAIVLAKAATRNLDAACLTKLIAMPGRH